MRRVVEEGKNKMGGMHDINIERTKGQKKRRALRL
jgi:hypothetical protein